MKNKKSKFQTVAAFMMGMASMFSPAVQAAPSVAAQAQSNTAEASNTKAVVESKERKGQGIEVNNGHDGDGGLIFNMDKMMYYNPIFEPRKHTVETYRSQQKRAKGKFKSRKGR
jgi:hypothetical protein